MTKDKQHLLERFVEMLEQSAGSSGVIVNYDDCASLAEAIQSLLVENDLLRKAAERGLEWAIDAANEINDATKDVFQNAMKDVRFIEDALGESE